MLPGLPDSGKTGRISLQRGVLRRRMGRGSVGFSRMTAGSVHLDDTKRRTARDGASLIGSVLCVTGCGG